MSSEQNTTGRLDSLVQGRVGPTLLRMSASMMIGFVAGAMFNITDTYFVSRLGTQPLAAMGYTFPMVMVIHGLVMGIGTGAASVLSRSIGRGDQSGVLRYTMHALLLGLLMTFILLVAGYISLERIAKLMGADQSTLPLVMDYMNIWFTGMLFVVIPIIGNNAIRSTGDTLTPSIIMTADLGLNALLDPLFIFGLGPVPAMGIQGAALATVISRSVALCASLYILIYRKQMLRRESLRIRGLLRSWADICHVGFPAAGSYMLMPIAAGIIINIVSGFGNSSVAAFSAGSRIEHFAAIPLIAMGASIVPFIGQNWGARSFDRVSSALHIGFVSCLIWGLFCMVTLAVFSRPLSKIFTAEAAVMAELAIYLIIMPISFAFRGMCMTSIGAMNAINRPIDSAANSVIRLFVLQLPMAWFGAKLYGFKGVLIGMVVAGVFSGLLSAFWASIVIRRKVAREQVASVSAS
ncbi:MAG: MATE family efflux transporter [Candidatus Alcyoniella australis]|nr:MATE family efflux transporter [Candidatus Alcyoniella australis]